MNWDELNGLKEKDSLIDQLQHIHEMKSIIKSPREQAVELWQRIRQTHREPSTIADLAEIKTLMNKIEKY